MDDLGEAAALFAELGFTADAGPFDASEIPHVDTARVAVSGRRKREGYALCLMETQEAPRSFRSLARWLRDHVHDRPLGVLGVKGKDDRWRQMVVMRPHTTPGGGVSVTSMEVDLRRPTRHDIEVLSKITWNGQEDRREHAEIDAAFDVEEVTNTFYRGLVDHYEDLIDGVQRAVDTDPAVANNLKRLGDDAAERAALRILTQILFVKFLQKQGHLEGNVDWLTSAYRAKTGPYYSTVLERLFYAGLGTPPEKRRETDPDVPYLNGGLFERFYGDISLPLPDETFDIQDGLLGYLNRWTFTTTEEMPDEARIAVDPEMLGKVFEHLAGEEAVKSHGTVYTPRPVVHFMCREALTPWLQERLELEEDAVRILLTDPDPFGNDGLAQQLGSDAIADLADELPRVLDDLTVLDPAVGSGAFLLGMLAEIIRIKRLCYQVLHQGDEPSAATVASWKRKAIKQTLFGVDIEPRAIELCRLRLWLSLLVDLPPGSDPDPLPNLDFRTVVADSLTDFVGGVEVQDTRGGLDLHHDDKLEQLHDAWFDASGNRRAELQEEIRRREDEVVTRQLARAEAEAESETRRARIEELAAQFGSSDRKFPCFMPALHAPELADRHGWDIVIMNPPYVGRKEIPKRLHKSDVKDLELHFGETSDLMILFGVRALQLARPGGIVSMIFNDSITTSTDGEELRRRWSSNNGLLASARTRCFEGKAITGGIVVARVGGTHRPGIRWIEGHGRPVAHFVSASDPVQFTAEPGRMAETGELEVWDCPRDYYRRLPHRPLFRPSQPALEVIDRYTEVKDWVAEWSKWDERSRSGWKMLSNTRTLNAKIRKWRENGWFDLLEPGDWTLFGLVTEGGQGLATADDKRFIAAIEGTEAAKEHRQNQLEFAEALGNYPEAAKLYQEIEASEGREAALLAVWDKFDRELPWSRTGTFRIAPADQVRRGPVTDIERQRGIDGPDRFVPYEKGDASDVTEDGSAIGAKWTRDNPLVIDWSREAVSLLRRRAEEKKHRAPRLQHEESWFRSGVAWNRTASYLRVRRVPENSIFSSEAPTFRPTVQWLDADALLALLNSDTMDFTVRTLLSSRMHLDIGDVRRLPIPVLDDNTREHLGALAREAVRAKSADEHERLAEIQSAVNASVRDLYGIDPKADLWVVR